MPIRIKPDATAPPATGVRTYESESGDWYMGGIVRDENIWGGRAVIENTRVPVFAIVDEYAEAGTAEAVVESFPELTPVDVYCALSYAETKPDQVRSDRETYRESIPEKARIR